MAELPSSWPGWPADVAHGPPRSDALGQLGLGVKRFCAPNFISENYRKLYNLVKCISFVPVVRKICMIYQNAQKNELYMFMSISCMINQP
jgi:hypothetical protein